MSGTLSLAASIAAMNRDDLEALLALRQPGAGASDPLALAAELLRPDSISRALVRLPREQLDALRSDPAAFEELRALGLVGLDRGDPAPIPEVTDALETALANADAVDPPPSVDLNAREQRDPVDTSHWYAPALTAVACAAECLRALSRQPGRMNRNGSLAVASVRATAEAVGIAEEDAASAIVAVRRAGLTMSRGRDLVPSPAGADWLALSHIERWVALATSAIAAMPTPLRTVQKQQDGAMASAVRQLPARFPLLPAADLDEARDYLEHLERLGLTVRGQLTPAAQQLLDGHTTRARGIAATEMPPIAAGVYVQPDLSIVIPGPLTPENEALIAAISRPEQVGVASTRRVTQSSLDDAFESGIRPDDARETLARLSLTGVPQPLDYLLNASAERLGSIVVGEHDGDDGRTQITVARPGIADTLIADRALHHLQLQRSDARVLHARLRPEHVRAALSDARYSVTLASTPATPSSCASAVNPGGETRQRFSDSPSEPRSGVAGPAPTPDRAQDDSERGLQAERIYLAARAEPSDFTRRLELAIRDRSRVRVTVETQQDTREFEVLPTSLDSGRLRGLDEAAGVERTLPVSMITAVE